MDKITIVITIEQLKALLDIFDEAEIRIESFGQKPTLNQQDIIDMLRQKSIEQKLDNG
jgi:hypothetical protein